MPENARMNSREEAWQWLLCNGVCQPFITYRTPYRIQRALATMEKQLERLEPGTISQMIQERIWRARWGQHEYLGYLYIETLQDDAKYFIETLPFYFPDPLTIRCSRAFSLL